MAISGRYQTAIVSAITIAVILGALGLQQGGEESGKATVYEKIIKGVVLLLIFGGVASYLIIPGTRIARRVRMTEGVYTATSVCGIICGLAGLAATLMWPQKIVELHLFELIFIPFALMYGYWGLIMKIRQTEEITDILDEKQVENIKRAAATTWAVVTGLLLIFFFISTSGTLQIQGRVWFMSYFFLSLLIFSASTVYYFKWD